MSPWKDINLQFVRDVLSQTISSLEKDIAGLKKEIGERDETISDKEKRIYDLKKKNQELEKFKFVLDYKIKELKKQIEPRELQISDMKDQIKVLFSCRPNKFIASDAIQFTVFSPHKAALPHSIQGSTRDLMSTKQLEYVFKYTKFTVLAQNELALSYTQAGVSTGKGLYND